MNYLPLKIGDKIAKWPIVQGGMGVGVSLSSLAGAVAAEGGVGIISSAQIGFKNSLFETNPFMANLKAIEEEFLKARKIAPEGIIGFNIMVALKHYKEYVVKAASVGADIIISGAGLATSLPEYVSGYMTKIAPIVSSKRAAEVLLKLWDRRYKRTADMVVIEGPKAGGHLGFSKEELVNITDEGYEKEICDIIETVKSYGKKYAVDIPVIVAGGIDSSKEVRKIMSLGANGVQVASRFVTSYECDVDAAFKQAYIDSKKEDIEIVTSPVGMPGRAIKNKFIQNVENGQKQKVKKCYGCLEKCSITDIPYCITEALINAAKGDVENGLVFCGANTYKIKKLESVNEIIESLLK